MKSYIKPSAEFIKIDVEDIIQTSGETPVSGFTKPEGISAASAGTANWHSDWDITQ